MGRTVVRQVEQRRGHRARDWLLLAGAATILTFAAVGVVSAAGYVGGKIATSPAKTHTHSGRPRTNAVALQDVARAQAQATAIVKAAQTTGRTIVSSETRKARHQASAIIAQARTRSKSRIAAVAPIPTSAPVSNTQAAGPATPVPYGAVTTGSTATPGYGAGSSGSAPGSTGAPTSPSTGAPSANTSGTTPDASVPSLGSVPATWLVVAYNATFGAGPGNAGSIAVINRSKTAFSGVARVNYIGSRGILGSATAPFSGLAPGQSEILPLNGMVYPSGAIRYQIEVTNVH